MVVGSVINLRCAMLRIALISLVALLAVCCTGAEEQHEHLSGDVSISYLCSLAESRSERVSDDVWIEGCVVLNDKLCESYKSFVLYDGTAGVEVEVDISNVDRVVPLYSKVRMRCEGLHIGREGARYVLGLEPTAEYVVDRITEDEVLNRMVIDVTGDARERARVRSIGDIGYGDMLAYVRVDGVQLISEERGALWCDADAEDRPFDSSLRHFTDGADTLTVATLNRCDYADEAVADGVVTLMGVVDSYEGELVLRLSDHKAFVPASPLKKKEMS